MQEARCSPTHLHLDQHNCLEVVIVKRRSGSIPAVANAMLSLQGVKHGAVGGDRHCQGSTLKPRRAPSPVFSAPGAAGEDFACGCVPRPSPSHHNNKHLPVAASRFKLRRTRGQRNEEGNLYDGFPGHDCAAGRGGPGHSTLSQNAVHVGAQRNSGLVRVPVGSPRP